MATCSITDPISVSAVDFYRAAEEAEKAAEERRKNPKPQVECKKLTKEERLEYFGRYAKKI
jgi:hypothetical protein